MFGRQIVECHPVLALIGRHFASHLAHDQRGRAFVEAQFCHAPFVADAVQLGLVSCRDKPGIGQLPAVGTLKRDAEMLDDLTDGFLIGARVIAANIFDKFCGTCHGYDPLIDKASALISRLRGKARLSEKDNVREVFLHDASALEKLLSEQEKIIWWTEGARPRNSKAMKIARFELSHFPATRSARVLWALYETADCPIEIIPVNLYGGEQYRPEYLVMNPNHNVPTLKIVWEDGTEKMMLESAAMIAFLADAYPEKGLAPLPGASFERADFLQMLHFGGSPMDMMLWQIRIHEHVLPAGERDKRTIARYRAKMRDEVEPQLAARLDRHAYICGESFTAADCMIGHNVTWARLYGQCKDEIFRDYLSRISKRRAFLRAFADAGGFDPKPPEDEPRLAAFSG
jgi:glutathione S-transferase